MSLKRKILNIFAAVVVAFGSMPTAFLTAFAEESTNPIGVPKNSKTVTPNGDGTYDITIKIDGVSSEQDEATKANVVVVLDTSGSMDTLSVMTASSTGRYGMVNGDYSNLYRMSGMRCVRITNDTTTGTVYSDNGCDNRYTGTRYVGSGSTRLQVAKDAINDLADQLLSQNDSSSEVFKDVVEMSFIDFSSSIKTNTTHNTASSNAPTTNVNTFQDWVDATSATGGTNWETALTAANNTSFGNGDDDKTYIIFVSDGNPTYRDSAYVSRPNDCSGVSCPPSPYGTGYSDPNSYNLNAAISVANTITAEGSNKELYTIGAFGSVSNMQSLGGNYYSASNQTALEEAFADIVDKITKGLSVADLEITDGVTSAASVPVPEHATAGAFRYSFSPTNDIWGAPGEGFAEAYFDETTRSVHWDPSIKDAEGNYIKHNTLSSGQSAAVTFTVWPSQEAMDCIAALQNGDDGVCSEDELEDFGLLKEGNSFSLITNTEASFTYKTVTTVDGQNPEYSAPYEVEIADPEYDSPLPITTLQVKKHWLDTMGSQLEDINGVSIKLYVDRKADSDPTRTYEFAKQSGNEWIGTDTKTGSSEYTVSPGVMKELDGTPDTAGLEDIAIKVVTVGNKRYAVLEEGHDYEFDGEVVDYSGSVNHYHITKREYHPMIVNDGEIHNVKFNEDGTATIEEEPLESLAVENTLNGGILVYKIVKNNGAIDREIEDEYTITISNIKDAEGNTLSHTDDNPMQYRIMNCSISGDDVDTYLENCSPAGSKEPFNNGTVTATIKANQGIMVSDLPTGATFEVNETLPKGYDSRDIDYRLVQYDDKGKRKVLTEEDGTEYIQTIFGNSSAQAIVTNNLSSGDLVISKTVDTQSGNRTKAESHLFGFTVYFYEPGNTETPVKVDDSTCNKKEIEVDGETVVQDNRIHHNQTCTIKNIPTGWTYKVVEGAEAGFNNGEETEKTGKIEKGGETYTADFENVYKVTPLTTDVFAKKGFTNSIFWLPSDNFTFQLKYEEAVKDSAIVNLDQNTATFTVTIPDEGEFKYTIAELKEGFRDGVSRVEGDDDIVWTIETEDNGDGTLTLKSKTFSKDEDDQTDDQTIYNQYKGTVAYEPEFTKDLQGREWNSNDKFTFTISSSDSDAPMPSKTSVTVDENNKTASFGAITFNQDFVNNKVYHYTVTETFDSSVIQSVVQSDDTKDGISFTIQVKYEDGQLKLEVGGDKNRTFINKYKTVDLSAKKVWVDGSDRDGKRDDYDFYVAVMDGDEFVTYKAIDVSGEENEENVTFKDLPMLRDGEEIEYKIVEAINCETSCKEYENGKDGVYTVSYGDDNVITNTYTPETKAITIKKTWDVPESGLPSTQPSFILVDLTNDENDEKKVVRLEGNDYGEWTSDPITVLAHKNHGEDITYEVKETGIDGEDNLTGDNKDTLYIYDGEILEGKWVAESVEDSFEVKNTWTPATNVYEGSAEFYIKKVSDKDRAMSGVKFTVNGEEKTTGSDGKIKIEVPEDETVAEDNLEYKIKETETEEGYDLISGTETLTVTSTSSFERADTSKMENYYTKTYSFNPTSIAGYAWNDGTYIVTNNRSKANSLKIEKTFSGVSKKALKDLTFTVTGPSDFGDDGE